MIEQRWAVVSPSGEFRIVFTPGAGFHPRDCGHADECRNHAVWPLERDLLEGERVDAATGNIVFATEHAQPGEATALDRLVSDIKDEAGRRILEAYPLWKQLNDRDLLADDPGVLERKALRDAIRAWSNDLEARATAARSAEDFQAIRAELAL